MVQYGYTCGERKSPSFMWARNLTRVTHSERFLSEQMHGITSYQSLLWAICQRKLDPTIVAEAEASWKDLPPLGWNSLDSSIEPVISIKAGEQDHELTGLPLGPPSGVCANVYEKYVHYCFNLIIDPPLIRVGISTVKNVVVASGLSH